MQKGARGNRRAEIAEAALRIIATRGVAALTTTAVAEELGVTSGALFRHYPSRDAILVEVAARVEEILRANIPAADLPPPDRLERFVRQRASTAAGHAGVLRLMVSEQFMLALPEAAASRLRGVIVETQRFLVATLSEGAAAGIFRSDIGAEELAIVVMGVTQMLAILGGLGPKAAGDERAAKMLAAVRTLLAPVATPTNTPRRA